MNQKTILCYGDSNTWGYVPNPSPTTQYMMRYSRNERWTGRLQWLLGENYYVIEEGLNGRTTNLDYYIPPDRNGKTYLHPCIYTHAPIDLVVLALGANDSKVYFRRHPEDICKGLAELVDMIQASLYGTGLVKAPKILIMTAPIILAIAEKFVDENGINVFAGADKKSRALVDLYAELAQIKNCYFLDTSKAVRSSEIDGGHYDLDAHKKLAEIIAAKIKTIFLAYLSCIF